DTPESAYRTDVPVSVSSTLCELCYDPDNRSLLIATPRALDALVGLASYPPPEAALSPSHTAAPYPQSAYAAQDRAVVALWCLSLESSGRVLLGKNKSVVQSLLSCARLNGMASTPSTTGQESLSLSVTESAVSGLWNLCIEPASHPHLLTDPDLVPVLVGVLRAPASLTAFKAALSAVSHLCATESARSLLLAQSNGGQASLGTLVMAVLALCDDPATQKAFRDMVGILQIGRGADGERSRERDLEGVTRMLLEAGKTLSDQDTQALLFPCATVLCNCSTQEGETLADLPGALPCLVCLLNHPAHPISFAAAVALFNLSKLASFRVTMSHDDATIDAIVAHTQHASPTMRLPLAQTLPNLSYAPETHMRLTHKEGVVPVVLSLVRSQDPALCQAGAATLWNLSSSASCRAPLLRRGAVLDALEAALSTQTSPAPLLSCLAALCNLAADGRAQLVARPGLMSVVVGHMKHTTEGVRELARRALSILFESSAEAPAGTLLPHLDRLVQIIREGGEE
ncbi:hypothetical protein KIPB_006403, partial [Kipferlia bialata]